MKQLILTFSILALSFFSCKKEPMSLTHIKGSYLFMEDAAVIQADTTIYGVILNDKIKELNAQVEPLKNDKSDMVPIEVEGTIIAKPKNEEGWPYRVKIEKIISVSKPNASQNDVIILGNEN